MASELKTVIDFLTESTPESELPHADAIFIFGHYNPRLAEHAVHLWKIGKAETIIVTGKGRDKIPEGYASEADYYVALLVQWGVPESALVVERESTNTLENVVLGMRTAIQRGLNPVSLILVSMPPLLRRSHATFRKQFPQITTFGSAFTMVTDEWMTPARLQCIIGEFDRLRDYAVRGDIAPVEIPESVARAVEELRSEL